MLIAQLSDCHLTAPGGRVADRADPAHGLARAIETINDLDRRHGVVLVVGTGDLANDGRPDEYDALCGLLAGLDAPFVALPGNHDNRSELRARFPGLPDGGPDDPIDHVVDLGRARLVCLDTTIPGRHDGRLTDRQLAWFDAELGADVDRPVIVAQHHPPVPSGIPSMDARFGLAGAEAEAAVLSRHDHVVGVIAGHYHRSLHQRFGGTVVTCCPSTTVQLALDFDATQALYSDEPTGIVVHRLTGEGDAATLASHVAATGPSEHWVPRWAVAD